MATKSSIHIKPCNIASSEAHNRRTAEYMRNIGESRIYVVPELSTDNEQWINPDFGSPDLRTHYDNIDACFIYTDEEGKLQTFLTKGMEKYMK